MCPLLFLVCFKSKVFSKSISFFCLGTMSISPLSPGLGPRAYPFTTVSLWGVHKGYISGHTSGSHVIVLLSRTVRSCIPFGAQWIGHSMMTWFAVCSSAPHMQATQVARPRLCTDEQKRPTPLQRQLRLAHPSLGRCLPIVGEPVFGMRSWSLKKFLSHSMLQMQSAHCATLVRSVHCCKSSFRLGTNGRLDLRRLEGSGVAVSHTSLGSMARLTKHAVAFVR